MTTRRRFILGVPSVAVALHSMRMDAASAPHRLYFGTNGGGSSKGIYTATWDSSTGVIGPIALAAEVGSPTFLALSHRARFLYAVSELPEGNAAVTAYAVTKDALRKLNSQTTMGNGATFVSIHPNGRSVYVANYGGGSVTSYKVEANGELSEPVSHIQYEGSGPNHDRQSRPHAHSAVVSPDGRFLLVNDLGLDRIVVYRVDKATAKLTPNDPPFWKARPATGPRHIAFHPKGHWVYNVNELDSTVDVLRWDAKRGVLTTQSHLSTLPPDFPPNTAFAGEILASADGRFVYVGNRRHESIAVLSVDPKSGDLSLIQLAPNGGTNTRHIALEPTGKWLVVSNQDSGTVVVLSRDAKTGKLSPPVHIYPLDRPMCAVFG